MLQAPNTFTALRFYEASSSLYPPDKKKIAGTDENKLLFNVLNVNLATS